MGVPQTLRMRRIGLAGAILVALVLAACGESAPPEDRPGSADQSSASATEPTALAEAAEVDPSDAGRTQPPDPEDILATLSDALGGALGSGGGGGRPIPDGLVLGGDCPAAGPGADEEIAAQAAAPVPLTVGLTLTSLWIPNPEEEYECLMQVTAVHRDSIDATGDCDHPTARRYINRRLCRADLDAAHMLMTELGLMTVIDASGEDLPESTVGATWFSLSRDEFAELKRTGSVRHHYVQFNKRGDRLEVESTAVLRRERAETARVAVNDKVIEVPVIRVSGNADHWRWGRPEKGRVTARILDNEQFPLLVDYMHTMESSEQPDFRLNFAKISFPEAGGDRRKGGAAGLGGLGGKEGMGEMERQLTENRRVDVYGIYFDFNSDRIRKQSAPILQEIADMLRRNPDWALSIDGHTDNIGGDAYNLDLSRRRSEAVRRTLVERYGIAATRLTTAGHGASAPKDTNETPEGRARNRRVELVRQ
jgi:outer membrane protein OmpA-like peptidoglycan-associated protein